MIIGISRISLLKFLLYEALTCTIWAIVIGSLGYYFGRAVERLLGRAAHIEKWGLLLLVIVGLGIWGYRKWKDRREDQPS